MEVIKGDLEGLLIFQPRVFTDNRGYFFESFNQEKFNKLTGLEVQFCQDNESLSNKDVIRGLHFQKPPFAQGKLVRVISGRVLDVAVDIRKSSPTYGKYELVELSGENKKIFWIPPGFAHGFVVMEENTVFSYKCSNYYSPESEGTIRWNDKDLKIQWPISNPNVSEKDNVGEDFVNFVSLFE